MKNKILYIAYYYPPCTATGVPGTLWNLKIINNLTRFSCEIVTKPPTENERDKNALTELDVGNHTDNVHTAIPKDIFAKILKAKSKLKIKKSSAPESKEYIFRSGPKKNKKITQKIKDFIYHALYFPDQSSFWILPAYKLAKSVAKNRECTIIFATGAPWSALVVGYLTSKKTGLPLIIEFQDPWTNNPFHQSKGKVLDKLAIKLERKLVAHAKKVALNNEGLLADFIARYPDESPDKFILIRSGYDLNLISDKDATPQKKDKQLIEICHTGFLYGLRDPAPLIDAISEVNMKTKLNDKKFVFHQVGPINLNYDIFKEYEHEISKGWVKITDNKSYLDCLKICQNSDILVNIQPGTKTQIPSKLYDYLAIERPIIHITPEDGGLGLLAKKFQIGKVFEPDNKDEISEYLQSVSRDPEAIAGFKGYENKEQFDIKKIVPLLEWHLENVLTCESEKGKSE